MTNILATDTKKTQIRNKNLWIKRSVVECSYTSKNKTKNKTDSPYIKIDGIVNSVELKT